MSLRDRGQSEEGKTMLPKKLMVAFIQNVHAEHTRCLEANPPRWVSHNQNTALCYGLSTKLNIQF
jgi:hypothetical protein